MHQYLYYLTFITNLKKKRKINNKKGKTSKIKGLYNNFIYITNIEIILYKLQVLDIYSIISVLFPHSIPQFPVVPLSIHQNQNLRQQM